MTNKMAKKAMGLKGFMNSMSKKKGEMGMGTSSSGDNKINRLQSQKYNVPVGTKYSTTVEKPKVRQTLGEYTTPPKSQAEASRYQQLKSASISTKPMMKKGGFPDLNKDGQITKADILMGRGVIKKPSMQMGGMSTKMMDKAKAKTYSEKRYEASNPMYKTAADKGTVKKSFETNKASLDSLLLNKSKKKGQKGMNVMDEAKKNATPSIPNSYYQMGGMKEENPLSGMLKESMKEKAMAKKKAMGKPMAKGKSMPKGKGKKKMQAGGRFMPGMSVHLLAGNDPQFIG